MSENTYRVNPGEGDRWVYTDDDGRQWDLKDLPTVVDRCVAKMDKAIERGIECLYELQR